jgi:hypothetical protein
MATDAFGRLRISNIYNLFEYYPSSISSTTTSSSDPDVDIWVNDKVNGTSIASATIEFDSSNTKVNLICGNSGDISTRFTKLPMRYQPGKSRLFYFSGVPLDRVNDGTETFTSRIGIFSTDSSTKIPIEGHYFQTNGTNLSWVSSYNSTQTEILQSNWNIDTFDGNGPSGKTLTISNMLLTNLFVIDQEWLGVGRIRVGFNIDGVNYYAHQFVPAVDYPYTTTPRLPITYQMSAGTSINKPVILGQVCCTCISEGGFTPIGRRISVSNGIDGVTLTNNSTKYILLGIKLIDGNITGILDVLSYDVLYFGNNDRNNAKIELQLHSTNGNIGSISRTISYTQEPNSIIDVYRGGNDPATILTDGFIISSKYLQQKTDINLNSTEYSIQLSRSEISQYDTLFIVAQSTADNEEIGATVDLIMSS